MDDLSPEMLNRIVSKLVGAWVNYEQLPYQLATPEYERLRFDCTNVPDNYGGTTIYQLDRQAAEDFVTQAVRAT